jgi:hypothetical protein
LFLPVHLDLGVGGVSGAAAVGVFLAAASAKSSIRRCILSWIRRIFRCKKLSPSDAGGRAAAAAASSKRGELDRNEAQPGCCARSARQPAAIDFHRDMSRWRSASLYGEGRCDDRGPTPNVDAGRPCRGEAGGAPEAQEAPPRRLRLFRRALDGAGGGGRRSTAAELEAAAATETWALSAAASM